MRGFRPRNVVVLLNTGMVMLPPAKKLVNLALSGND